MTDTQNMINIVVLDDNDPFRKSVTRILTIAGYGVRDFAQPEDAIDFIRSHPESVSLLLVDGAMPRISGPEVAARVKDIRRQLPVLLMSGHEAPVFTKFLGTPDNHFIAKPFVASDLISRVAGLIGHATPLPLVTPPRRHGC